MPSVPERGAQDDLPINDRERDGLLAPLSGFSSLALGVSGGPDSVALLRLVDDWRVATGWPGRLVVFTVDHGLRPESAAEAAEVADLCERLGLPHQTLLWDTGRPASGTGNLQALARQARYELLDHALGAQGLEGLVLAHHRDDQVETFLDRLTRGSGVYGLAGMASVETDGLVRVPVLRPLLGVPKSRLLATLRVRGQGWREDPSNSNVAFKRVRLRQLAEELACEGLDTSRILQTARRMGRAAEALDRWVQDLRAAHVERHLGGPMRLPWAVFTDLPEEVRLRLLGTLLRDLGRHQVTQGRAHPARLSRLEGLDERLRTEDGCRSSLGGCVIWRDGAVLRLWPEPGRDAAQAPVIRLDALERVTWDNRYRIAAEAREDDPDAGPLFLGPWHLAPKDGGLMPDADHLRAWGGKAAFGRAPAVWRGGRLLQIAGLDVAEGHRACGFEPL